MNTETAVATTGAGTIAQRGEELEVTAFTPQEMLNANHALILWCERKIEAVKAEAADLTAAFKEAVERKWKSSTLKRHAELASRRVTFYEKIKAALDHGFYIVPNFPITLFGIRTDKKNPKRMWARLRWAGGQNFEQKAEILPVGQGEYQNPQPVVERLAGTSDSDEKTGDTWAYQASDWDEMEFPTNMAKLQIMEAATRAMDAKIFDEVGFLPQDHKRNPDPLLIGRIYCKSSSAFKSDWKHVSFIIAWHLDTKTL